jgi:hypothetical protein
MRRPIERVELARDRRMIWKIFAGWGGRAATRDLTRSAILHGALTYLAPLHRTDAVLGSDDRVLLNAQLSVDSHQPDVLRLALDPFAGRSLKTLAVERTLAPIRVLRCEMLTRRVAALHDAGVELPQNLWIGAVLRGGGPIVKAYISSRALSTNATLPYLARRAGWLPGAPERSFTQIFNRLVPFWTELEGIGISFQNGAWSGATVYLRGIQPWHAYLTSGLWDDIGLGATPSIERLSELVAVSPMWGWSLECDPAGRLVNTKFEVGIGVGKNRAAICRYVRDLGISSVALETLGHAIDAAALSEQAAAPPAVMSLRYVDRQLQGVVAYFRLTTVGAIPTGGRKAARPDAQHAADRNRSQPSHERTRGQNAEH